jgi:hypothetical protein
MCRAVTVQRERHLPLSVAEITGAGGPTPAPGNATVPQGACHHPAPNLCRYEVHRPAAVLSIRPPYDDEASRHRHFSAHANQAAHVTEVSLESDHRTDLRGGDGISHGKKTEVRKI